MGVGRTERQATVEAVPAISAESLEPSISGAQRALEDVYAC
jgi:hypothetical protein